MEDCQPPLPNGIALPRDPRDHADKRPTAKWYTRLEKAMAVAVIALAAFWAFRHFLLAENLRAPLPTHGAAPATPEDRGVTVTTVPVVYRAVERSVEAFGTLFGFEEVVVTSRVDGRILRVHRDIAQRVRQHDLLLEIDPTDAQLAVDEAEYALKADLSKLGLTAVPEADFNSTALPAVQVAAERVENTRSRLERMKRLHSKQAASTAELENAESEHRIAVAEHANQLLIAKSAAALTAMRLSSLQLAQQKLTETLIRVPPLAAPLPPDVSEASYVISQRAVSEGTSVRVGTELFRLTIDDVLKLRVAVPERFASEIAAGQPVRIEGAASPTPDVGTVTLVNPTVDPSNRTFQVEIQILNETHRLKPGGFAKASIVTSVNSQSPTVPVSAVTTSLGNPRIFLVNGESAKEVPVRLGVQTDEWFEVIEPALSDTTLVVVSGQSALTDGAALVVRENVEAEMSEAALRSARVTGATVR